MSTPLEIGHSLLDIGHSLLFRLPLGIRQAHAEMSTLMKVVILLAVGVTAYLIGRSMGKKAAQSEYANSGGGGGDSNSDVAIEETEPPAESGHVVEASESAPVESTGTPEGIDLVPV